MLINRRSSDAWRHRVLGVRCGADPVLHALAPLGLAAARGTALVVDLDREAPSYPGAASLAALVVSQPRLDDLRPRRSGVAVLPNGSVDPVEAVEVVDALVSGWPAVVFRLGASHDLPPSLAETPVIPVSPLLPGFPPPSGDRPGGLPGDVRRAASPGPGDPAAAPGPIPHLPHAGRHGVSSPALGARLGERVEPAMALIDRLVDAVLLQDFPTDRAALTRHVRKVVTTEAPLAPPGVVEKVVDSLIGMGPLEELLRDPEVTDVLVNSPSDVWVERAGRLERSHISFGTDQAVTAAVERVIAPLGLRIDRASPMVDARLADGSRLHAVIPPAAVEHPVVAVRRFVPQAEDLEALVELGSVTPAQAGELRAIVRARRNLLVSGGTGAGKTTLLNVLSGLIDGTERVVVVEDASELRMRGHVVRLEGRPANSEGRGAITLRQLIRSALRLRPDRIVVGEVRGPEALDLVSALNTGHSGSMSTLHANNPSEALWRLETLALMGARNLPADAVRAQIRSAIDVVIQVERAGGLRRVATIEHHPGSR